MLQKRREAETQQHQGKSASAKESDQSKEGKQSGLWEQEDQLVW